MRITPAVVAEEREWVRERAPVVVALINETRAELGERFDTEVDEVTAEQYRSAVDEVFADGDRAVNVAALVRILRDLDVVDDYPGFVVDELLGRELAGTIAGDQPLRLLGEATFHYADVAVEETVGPAGVDDGDPAGLDDLDAALAAGFQTRLPGWEWREGDSPFAVERSDGTGSE
ncbi:hypothetical protein C475_18248 [Halosimplex carlsbadense 2-9-1]|uniref:DUF7984 domain-containing protein n=1 Tax=Halosimplex carlsbadense 2-9-1 TaxID=797114 RepID=M0CGR3_9EURY|nr:hypothetical protein [Halosimplex carlsbadense]ELZ22480.1 hypothetical protein C475_18248 [Halosimplex carlsbadense 2-9-1]